MAGVCTLLSVGDELLLGLTVDTNAAWLARELALLGWTVRAVRTEGDRTAAIVDALREAAAGSDAVIVTGGLGPTEDDRSREALAQACGVPLEERAELVAAIEERFRAFGRPMRPSNLAQARIPRGAQAIPNPNGTAPGIAARLGSARVFALPGVPFEMREMFAASVAPALGRTGEGLAMRRLHLFGPGESQVGETLRAEMAEAANPEVGTTVDDFIVTVRALARGPDATALCDHFEATVRDRFGPAVFGRNGETLAVAAVAALAARGWTLALAESCTGGGIASRIVDVPGASRVFSEGFVTYADAAKTRLLGVPEATLRAHGAVSRETAAAMARGLRQRSGADLALAVTGVAGPDGGTPEKPVGTVWLALAAADGMVGVRRMLGADRAGNRARAAHLALDLIRRKAGGLPWADGMEDLGG